MEIRYLADNLIFLETLARWHHDEWSHFVDGGGSIEARRASLLARANHRAIPTVFVAADRGQVFGSATLAVYAMQTRRDLTPWPADEFVAPDFSRQGIDSARV